MIYIKGFPFLQRNYDLDCAFAHNASYKKYLNLLPFLPYLSLGNFNGAYLTPIVANVLRTYSVFQRGQADQWAHRVEQAYSAITFLVYFFNPRVSICMTLTHDTLVEMNHLRGKTSAQRLIALQKIISNILTGLTTLSGGRAFTTSAVSARSSVLLVDAGIHFGRENSPMAVRNLVLAYILFYQSS